MESFSENCIEHFLAFFGNELFSIRLVNSVLMEISE